MHVCVCNVNRNAGQLTIFEAGRIRNRRLTYVNVDHVQDWEGVLFLEYTDIQKLFFTRHLVGHCWTNVN
jgi:hypothetical protein